MDTKDKDLLYDVLSLAGCIRAAINAHYPEWKMGLTRDSRVLA